MDFKGALADFYDLKECQVIRGCYRHTTSTPTHVFVNWLKTLGDVCMSITARDVDDERFVAKVFAFVESDSASMHRDQVICKLGGFQAQPFPFDCIALFSPAAHDEFKVENPALHAVTYAVAPIFSCEFTGDEDAPTARLIRSSFPTIDWKRSPHPKMRLRYDNKATDSWCSEFELASLDTCLHEISTLPDDNFSFVDIENFKGMCCRITRENDGLRLITFSDAGLKAQMTDALVHPTQANDRMRQFTIKGAVPV